jgi:aminocarboxymuconate-semialdehyde decarboxylase
MRTIDIHAHLVPRSLWQAVDARKDWYGFRHEPGDGIGTMVGDGKRTQFSSPKVRFTPEERLKDMDAQGVDVQVVSIHTPFFGYHLDPAQGRALARDVNDEIAGMARQWPRRFAGLATLPVQDVTSAIDELERAVTVLGLKGAELDTAGVNGESWDEAKFRPLFKAAEAMGAVLFFHPQPQHNFMLQRTTKYGLFNSLGVIVDDAICIAMLIYGGVLDACPTLKVCIAHGGGPACYAMGRMDRGWQGMPVERRSIPHPPAATSAACTTTPWSAARRCSASCSMRSGSTASCSAATGRSCRGIRRRSPGCRV